MKELFSLISLIISLLLSTKATVFQFSPRALPLIKQAVDSPRLSARSALLVDVDSGTVIFQKNPHFRLNPASITKMTTAIAALEIYPVDEIITVKAAYPVGKTMNLEADEKISVENLIYGLLIHSANDAAFVLAGQQPKKVKTFIERMNQLAEELGLKDTHFVNFDGEDDLGHYSTAWDLAQLSRWALRDNIFIQAVGTREISVWDVRKEISHHLETTNELLGVVPEIKGIKTGWTPIAGECFVSLIQLENRRLISVVLNSNNRFGDTKTLVNWAKQSISWRDYSSSHSNETAGT